MDCKIQIFICRDFLKLFPAKYKLKYKLALKKNIINIWVSSKKHYFSVVVVCFVSRVKVNLNKNKDSCFILFLSKKDLFLNDI